MRSFFTLQTLVFGLLAAAVAIPVGERSDGSDSYNPEPILDAAALGAVDYFKPDMTKRGDDGSITYVKPISEIDTVV